MISVGRTWCLCPTRPSHFELNFDYFFSGSTQLFQAKFTERIRPPLAIILVHLKLIL